MIRIGKNFIALILAALVLGGCATPPPPAKKAYVVLLQSPDGSTGQIVVTGTKGSQVVNQAKTGVALDGASAAQPVTEEMLKRDFGDAMSARPLLPKRFLLYFDTGGTRLTADSMALIPKIIAESTQWPAVDISVIGHTDTVGKPDLNERLALARAQSVAELLSNRGLKPHALSVESHGERNLLIQTPDETAEPRNRRVEISLR